MIPTVGTTRSAVLITLVVLAALAAAVVALLQTDPRGVRGPRTGRRYVDAVREASRIDPGLVAWSEVLPPVVVDLDEPQGLAVDGGDRVHVIGDRLVVFDAERRRVVRTEPFTDHYGALAVDADGSVLAVADRKVDVIEVRDGRAVVAGSCPISDPGTELASIAITATGVYVADAGGGRILRLGLPVGRPAKGSAAYEVVVEHLDVPSVMDVAVHPDGGLVTVDPGRHLVQMRDRYGDVLRSWGKMGKDLADFHGCCNPAAIAMMADGRTVTAEKGLAVTRVKVYDVEGRFLNVVAGPDQFDVRPDGPATVLDVAVDSRGRVLVLDPVRRQVRTFVPRNDRRRTEAGK